MNVNMTAVAATGMTQLAMMTLRKKRIPGSSCLSARARIIPRMSWRLTAAPVSTRECHREDQNTGSAKSFP